MRVLAIVDDTPDVRRMVRVLLERSGAEVEAEASSVEELMTLLSPDDQGMVVLDNQLDGELSGLEGAAMIRQHVPGASIVLFSALDLSSDVEANSSIDAFVRKDAILELPSVIRRVMQRRQREWDAQAPPTEVPAQLALSGLEWSDRLLLRWLTSPPVVFDRLVPPVEAAVVIDHLLTDNRTRSDVLLRLIAASGEVDVAVAHLLSLRELIAEDPVFAANVNLRLLDVLIVETTTIVIDAARQIAMVDPLTSLGNRRALDTDLASTLARADRSGGTVSLLYFDLVGLKQTNDRHGHEAGDRALRAFATALKECKRASDTAYRVGGDEFVALLPETTASDASILAARIADSGAPPFSWGVANTDRDGFEPTGLVRVADIRMLAKRYGRADEDDSLIDLNDSERRARAGPGAPERPSRGL